MKINEENAKKLWKKRNGSCAMVDDFTGRLIHIDDYNKRDATTDVDEDDPDDEDCPETYTYYTGWNLHHIMPGGSDDEENLEIVNIITNDDAADKTTFESNGTHYQVKKIKGTGYHGIYDLDADEWVVDNTK